jgi:hypothetical protein
MRVRNRAVRAVEVAAQVAPCAAWLAGCRPAAVGSLAARPARASPSQAFWQASRFVSLRVAPTPRAAGLRLPFLGPSVALSGTRRDLPRQEHDPSPHNRRIYVAWPLAMPAPPGRRRLGCGFVSLGPRFTLHASFPCSVALTQLRFTCLAVASLAGDLRPEDRAHAGRTHKKTAPEGAVLFFRLEAGSYRTTAICSRLSPL